MVGYVAASVEGVGPEVNCDSGAQQTTTHFNTLKKLAKQGHHYELIKLDEPRYFKGLIGPGKKVTHKVRLNLKFQTKAGPLILSIWYHLKTWMSP